MTNDCVTIEMRLYCASAGACVWEALMLFHALFREVGLDLWTIPGSDKPTGSL